VVIEFVADRSIEQLKRSSCSSNEDENEESSEPDYSENRNGPEERQEGTNGRGVTMNEIFWKIKIGKYVLVPPTCID
jgi:hypothetical protein